MNDLPLSLPSLEPGWVWLTGAGPGDPGLLTLHAVNGLKQAEIVVYDALVGKEILDLAPAGCELVYAGKRGGRPSPSQTDISQRLIAFARAGKRVLRLKGGDPFIFGRGGEEALSLVAAQVPFRIIPGISSGVGGLAYAGIPLTHRDTNSAVTFITGHVAGGAATDNVDWAALARGAPVLVIYMALKHLAIIAGTLMAHGRPAEEAVAIIGSATLPEQRVLETTLGRCAQAAQDAGLTPPCLVVVGEVVRLRDGLDWQGALAGKALVSDPLKRRGRREAG